MQRRRPFVPYAVAALLVLLIGLATRPARHFLPLEVTKTAGDILYALFAYCLLTLLRPAWPARLLFTLAFVFCAAVEFSQLYHAAWLDAIRQTTLGGLILGWGFAGTDLLSYLVGATLGYALDRALSSPAPPRRGGPGVR